MSRRDGSFPPYTKLKIDPDSPPEDYFINGSRRCSDCGKCWPNISYFSPSPCCNVHAGINPNSPDMSWSDAVKALLAARFERWYKRWDEDITDEELLHDPNVVPPPSKDDIDSSIMQLEKIANSS